MTIRPMLAAQFDPIKVQAHLNEGPLEIEPKIDGMRILVSEAMTPLSRSGKEYKQKHIRRWLQDHPSLMYVDGEVVAGHQYDENSFRESMSGIRAEDGASDFTFYAFDHFGPEVAPYELGYRRDALAAIRHSLGSAQDHNGYNARLIVVTSKTVTTLGEIAAEEQRLIAAGWEGAILRNPRRPYKFGRSTANEGTLVKIKRFEDAEAIVVGYEPWYHNANEAASSPLGFTARSAHQDNLHALERLGAIQVELLTDRSVKFSIGVFRGLTHGDRDQLWSIRETLIGRIAKFKHQGYGGGYDAPRTPVWLGWRNPIDIG